MRIAAGVSVGKAREAARGRTALALRSGRAGRLSRLVLGLLVVGWLAQLPLVHQVHLLERGVEHIWCPQHRRIEHRHANLDAGSWARASGPDSTRAFQGSKTKTEHQACPLNLMHPPFALLLQAPASRSGSHGGPVEAGAADPLLCGDVLSYAPKLSPPRVG